MAGSIKYFYRQFRTGHWKPWPWWRRAQCSRWNLWHRILFFSSLHAIINLINSIQYDTLGFRMTKVILLWCGRSDKAATTEHTQTEPWLWYQLLWKRENNNIQLEVKLLYSVGTKDKTTPKLPRFGQWRLRPPKQHTLLWSGENNTNWEHQTKRKRSLFIPPKPPR